MESEKLMPCPFCGGKAFYSSYGDGCDKSTFIECGRCAASSGMATTKKEARELWNRRNADDHK